MSNLAAPPGDTRHSGLTVIEPVVEPPPPPPPPPSGYVQGPVASNKEICGPTWTLHVLARGGGATLDIPKLRECRWNRRLDDISSLDASWVSQYRPPEPWETELALYADGDIAWVGPVVDTHDATGEPHSVKARDVSQWLERWFVQADRTFVGADLARVFVRLARDAAAAEPSVGIETLVQDCGIVGDRAYVAALYDRVSDKLRELARTGVDYTVLGRRILIGGPTVPTAARWRLIDPMCDRAVRHNNGLTRANDCVVLGSKPTGGDTLPVGRSTSEPARRRSGLLQTRDSEPDIKDVASANEAARTRREQRSSALPDLTVLLREGEYDVATLIPGADVDVDLSDELLVEGQSGAYRLRAVDGTVGDDGTGSVAVTLTERGADG